MFKVQYSKTEPTATQAGKCKSAAQVAFIRRSMCSDRASKRVFLAAILAAVPLHIRGTEVGNDVIASYRASQRQQWPSLPKESDAGFSPPHPYTLLRLPRQQHTTIADWLSRVSERLRIPGLWFECRDVTTSTLGFLGNMFESGEREEKRKKL